MYFMNAARVSPKLLLIALLSGVACSDSLQTLTVTLDTMPAKTTLVLEARSQVDVQFTAPGGLLELLIDCSPGEDPDVRGFSFSLSGSFTTPVPRAGYVRSRQDVSGGPARFQLLGYDGPAQCVLSIAHSPTACSSIEEFHSVNVDHNHVDPGDEPRSDWEPFPVSGNHYPAWAGWNREYDLPIRTGYLLHNLEHGGIVLSYGCHDTMQSPECTQATTELTQARATFAQMRTLLTPDPSQPALYAARGWRWGYTSSCYDETDLSGFMQRHFRKGREDSDAETAPFDPTQ